MPYESRAIGTASIAAVVALFAVQRRYLSIYRKRVGEVHSHDDANVSMNLFKHLRRMVSIALPSIYSKEAIGTMFFVLLFALQAMLNVIRSNADGKVIQSMLSRHPDRRLGISRAITQFIASSLMSSCIASLIEHVRHSLIASYRATLTTYYHKRFFDKLTFYHATVLDDRVTDADTQITKYCHEFAEHFAELPYYFVLPFLEAAMSFYAIVTQVGMKPAMMMSGVVITCLAALQQLTPAFGRMHASLMQREDDFRRLHIDVNTNVEQVAMHQAGEFTRNRANTCFFKVKEALDQLALAKGHFAGLENVISTAVWDVVGLLICGKLITESQGAVADAGKAASGSRSGLLSLVVVQRRLILSFHTAVKAFIVNFKEMSHLTEYTEKLSEFDMVLDSIARGEFMKKPDPRFIQDDGELHMPDKDEYMGMMGDFRRTDSWHLSLMSPSLHTPSTSSVADNFGSTTPNASVAGSHSENASPATTSLVEFRGVTIVTPNGVTLVDTLELSIEPKQNWAITGPNGCGKSSLLRVLAGMWLPSAGTVYINPNCVFSFLPQNPYMLGNCVYAEQITFPDPLVRDADGSVDDKMRERIKNAVENAEALQVVEEVLGGWGSDFIGLDQDRDNTFDWYSLSGGQQQKTALARMFYRAAVAKENDQFPVAVMDESTSQMDHDAERKVFKAIKHVGITCISVSHRENVIRHHKHVLSLTRDASAWSIDNSSELSHQCAHRMALNLPNH